MSTINDIYINALLADSAYVNGLEDQDSRLAEKLSLRMTQLQANFIAANFSIASHIESTATGSGFDATVWQGILQGGQGLDTYKFSSGDGADQITDPDGGWIERNGKRLSAASQSSTNEWKSADATYTRSADGKDLLVAFAGGDTLTLKNFDFTAAQGQNAATDVRDYTNSADGGWTLYGIQDYNMQPHIFDGGDDDTLIAGSKGDILVGGAGNDLIQGGKGNDTAWGDLGPNSAVTQQAPGNDQIALGDGAGQRMEIGICSPKQKSRRRRYGASILIPANDGTWRMTA